MMLVGEVVARFDTNFSTSLYAPSRIHRSAPLTNIRATSLQHFFTVTTLLYSDATSRTSYNKM
jgi:hypothetical protein